MTTATAGFLNATPLLGDPAALRAQAEQDGFLFFKGLLPRETVLELRLQFLAILDQYGLLDREAGVEAGLVNAAAVEQITKADVTFCGTGVPFDVYASIQRLEAFHRLAHHPYLLRVFETLFERPFLPHPRNIARIMLPSAFNTPTPPHQDFLHVQGTTDTWTTWVPIGDVPRALGSLTLIRGSHRNGLMDVKEAEGAGNLETWLCGPSFDWVEDDYEAGDAVVFHSYTVHKALPAKIRDRVRLSCDFRYQPLEQTVEEKSLRTHCDVLEWEEIYAGWERDDLKYYWHKHDLRYSPWDESIRWQKDKIC